MFKLHTNPYPGGEGLNKKIGLCQRPLHADHRGKGISKLLLQPLINRAREMGLHAMIAGIDADNEVSYKLHQSFGFVEVAHFKEVGFKFGRWLDLKFMKLSPL